METFTEQNFRYTTVQKFEMFLKEDLCSVNLHQISLMILYKIGKTLKFYYR